MQTLTYEETVTAIENKRRFGNLKGVEISKIMLEKLGHPEKDLRIIHIAGTNGKGSVSAFLRSVFECAGLKTGMFTSPHLVDFRERIQVQGDMISKEDTIGGLPIIKQQRLLLLISRSDGRIQRRAGAGVHIVERGVQAGVGEQAGVEGFAGPAAGAIEKTRFIGRRT